MKILRINNFATSGLNSDLLPWDLDGSFLTHVNNIRISRMRLNPNGGSSVWATLPVDFEPGYLFFVPAGDVAYWMILGKDSVLIYDGGTFTDISATAGYGDVNNEDLWHGCFLANIPVINIPGHGPEYWPTQSAGVDLEHLPWDASNTWQDVNESVQIMRSHKQFLFGLNVTSNGTDFIDAVRWSSPADIGGIPETWDPLDTTNVAGIVNLGGDGGKIIDGLSMRDAFVVYRRRSISVFDFVGGPFVWQIRHVSTTTGLISPDCIVEVKGRHYFIGDGDILVFDGNTIKSLLHNRIRVRFTSDYSPVNFENSYVVKVNIFSEIWFCVPSTNATYPNIAYVYNWKDDSWSIRDIPEAPFTSYGAQAAAPITWETILGTWDTVIGSWAREGLTPLNDTVINATKPAGAGQSGELQILSGYNVDNPGTFDPVVERTGFALEGLDTVTTITRIYPHMVGPSPVNIRVGSQDFPGAPVRWKDEISFDPDTDRKMDIRTTGELHCFRFSNADFNGNWGLSGMDIEYTIAGKR